MRALERHAGTIEVGFWAAFLGIGALVESLSVLTEYRRIGRPLAVWEPFVWEFSSALVTALLVIAVARFDRRFPLRANGWQLPLVLHLLATVPFSLAHVGGMVAIRKLIYSAVGQSYDFGPLASELTYEFRKDFVTYWFILAIVYLWRHLRRNRRSTAAEASGHAPLRRLMARKRGREFVVNLSDVDWIEAAGNYANLHQGGTVYPVRTSMAQLETRLDSDRFARVHRSYIVNLDRMVEIEPTEAGDYRLKMQDGAEIRLSRRYRAALKGRLG